MSTLMENWILKSVSSRRGWRRGRCPLPGCSARGERHLGSAGLSGRGGEECRSLRAGGCPGRRGEPRGALELVAPPAACCLPFRAFPDFDLFFLTWISSWTINWLNCVPAARARILFFSGYFHCGGARIHILDSRYPPPPPQQVGLGRTRAWGSQAPGQIM